MYLKINQKNDIIVSLTSYPARINTVHITIKSILKSVTDPPNGKEKILINDVTVARAINKLQNARFLILNIKKPPVMGGDTMTHK